MILVDCMADWLNVAYRAISRPTRSPSALRVSRRLFNSAISRSISCTDVPATRCSSELILLADLVAVGFRIAPQACDVAAHEIADLPLHLVNFVKLGGGLTLRDTHV